MVTDLAELVGKRLLFGVTYLDSDGELLERFQACGTVTSADPDDVVAIDVPGDDEPFTLPPAPEAYDPAEPGEYRLRSTGEVVVDPDFVTSWTIREPDGDDDTDEDEQQP